MTVANYSIFHKYKKKLQSLPPSLSKQHILSGHFLLEKDDKKRLEIYYAPFEYVNKFAKVVIVGITPGLQQMKQSFSTVLNANNQHVKDEELLHQVKNESSYKGQTRENLVQMLDDLGLHQYLNLISTNEFFNEASHLVHTTSVISYPVFYNGGNYNGSKGPKILSTGLLKKYVIEHLVTEFSDMNNPLIIPLGERVAEVFKFLVEEKLLKSEHILFGFPHPSNENRGREEKFAENKNQMEEKVRAYF